jgi:bla regulator protein blaR1
MNSLQWTQLFLSVAFQTSVLLLATWALDKFAGSSHSRVRMWTCCYISILGLVAAGLLLPRLQLLDPWAYVEPKALIDVARAQHAIGVAMVAIWIMGMFVSLLRWTRNHFQIKRVISSCDLLSESQFAAVQGFVDRDESIDGKKLLLLVSKDEHGPFCYQFHQPIIVLPHSLFDADPIDLRNVLVHELTHLRSRHAMQLFLERMAQVVLWFQPLVWSSSRRASLVREYECDDASANDRESTIAYLKTLLKIAERRAPYNHGTLSISRTPSQLRLRATRLVNQEMRNDAASRPSFAFVPIILAFALSQCWLPTNPLASPNSSWSAWPSWSASLLHEFNVPARDFEKFSPRTQLYELLLWEKRSST